MNPFTVKDNRELISYCGVDRNRIDVSPPVETIRSGAFQNITACLVTLPSTVTQVQAHSFSSCQKLTLLIFNGKASLWESITHPESFADCPSLLAIHCDDSTVWIKEASIAHIRVLSALLGEEMEYRAELRYVQMGTDRRDATCQYRYAKMLQLGLGMDKPDTEGAMRYYHFAATQKEKNALYELGSFHEYGMLSCPKDIPRAQAFYLDAAMQGHEGAQKALMEHYEHHRDLLFIEEKQMIPIYASVAERGDYDALLYLVVCRLIGAFMEADATAAASYLSAIAKKELYDGVLYFLGFCYEHGLGVPKSNYAAQKLYRNAADAGDLDAVRAAYYLALSIQDAQEIQAWESKHFDSLYESLTEEDFWSYNGRCAVRKANKSAAFYRFAADHNDVNGTYSYARCLEWGRGVPRDLALATAYYEKAFRLSPNRETAKALLRMEDEHHVSLSDDVRQHANTVMAHGK